MGIRVFYWSDWREGDGTGKAIGVHTPKYIQKAQLDLPQQPRSEPPLQDKDRYLEGIAVSASDLSDMPCNLPTACLKAVKRSRDCDIRHILVWVVVVTLR